MQTLASAAPINNIPNTSSPTSKQSQSTATPEKFDKILQREVSEGSSKSDTNPKSFQTDSSIEPVAPENDKPSTETLPDKSSNNGGVNNLSVIEVKSSPDLPNYLFDTATNPNSLITPLAIPGELTTTLIPGNVVTEGDGSTQAPSQFTNLLLQKRLTSSVFEENHFSYASDDFLQSFGAANSADFGKLYPVIPDAIKPAAIQTENISLTAPIESVGHPLSELNTAMLTTPSSTNSTPVHDIHVEAVVGQPKWDNEFAQKIVWMGNQQQQVAEIHLNPANLGPVEVTLNITQDQATAQFISPHAFVRDAIQDALPRLKEMLADNGIQLGNVTVGAESFQQSNQQQAHNLPKNSFDSNNHTTETTSRNEITATAPIRHQGIVNTYA
ncbi:flagellar hook-length control protein FliK [Nitrosomonas sp. PY1]|uniref:flagellar hook-length control protein FliK n=1 Tax=Nitrosomonas sp. PY1 TaxID=1803906 RepID=UPI001FC80F41|nr:flagellar hook-length control protein FliK [Nitrosomonas sp. PY1]GKS68052.1 flagellar hook-length control protein FliK [Nitrosomonas sp. PY1]